MLTKPLMEEALIEALVVLEMCEKRDVLAYGCG